ncbi:hypothetical protein FHS19_004096 [Paenibacillus rhizosphaerae]|uniref:Uncharacterized protein n=1 Tax=Paenibacillus rhizosphaerae TaxID=297318 RepID=A0A839TSA9_9BACL|nr:hypothetical protein [Paenibacillus rhizosphaerae]
MNAGKGPKGRAITSLLSIERAIPQFVHVRKIFKGRLDMIMRVPADDASAIRVIKPGLPLKNGRPILSPPRTSREFCNMLVAKRANPDKLIYHT